jgi:hypothetical protein
VIMYRYPTTLLALGPLGIDMYSIVSIGIMPPRLPWKVGALLQGLNLRLALVS